MTTPVATLTTQGELFGLPAPDLTSYDVILVNSSAGKDSQAMLDYLVGLADDSGVSRDRFVVVHCDLGRAEWAGTAELAAEQAAHYGIRFVTVRRELGDLLTQVEQRHEANVAKGRDIAPWPSSEARWCTSDQKTSQVTKQVTKEVAARRPHLGRKVRILNCLGIRADESAARALKVPFGPDPLHWGTPPSKKRGTPGIPHTLREADRWLPVFDWTEERVWATIKASGVRYHWAYDLGMRRLSCCFCVLASKADLLISARHNRELAQEYLAIENRTGKRFTQALSMAEIIAEVEREVAA